MAALIRGLTRRRARTIGNFWVDLVRTTFRVILLPLAFVFAVVLVRPGRHPEPRTASTRCTRSSGARAGDPGRAEREPGGDQAARHERRRLLQRQLRAPVREPERHHQLPRDLRDRCHPVRARVHVRPDGRGQAPGLRGVRGHGHDLARRRRARDRVRGRREPRARRSSGWTRRSTTDSPGGNPRARRCGSGPSGSAICAAATTGTSNGSVNSMHDSYTPLGGMMPLVHMKLGEISPGGVGVGLNGLLVFVLLSVFIAGLMVGRTPEYLGKKIQATEVKLVVALHPGDAARRARRLRDRDRRRSSIGARRHDLQPGPARVHRDPLRVHLGGEQQRLGVRRHHRQHRST